MTDIQLSCYTGPWGPTGLIDAIAHISTVGFDGLECPAAVVAGYEDRLHVFEEIMQTSSLCISSLLQPLDLLDTEHPDEQVERAANAARFLASAGGNALVVCHHKEVDGTLSDDEWATLGAICEEIGERCNEFGIHFCFFPRARRLCASEKDIKRFLASTRPALVNIALDTAEVVLAGSNPQRILKANLDRVRHVRYREASASKRRSKSTSNKPGTTPQFGRGAVNFESISKILITGRYTGWITLDVSGDSHTPQGAIDTGYRFLVRHSGLFSL